MATCNNKLVAHDSYGPEDCLPSWPHHSVLTGEQMFKSTETDWSNMEQGNTAQRHQDRSFCQIWCGRRGPSPVVLLKCTLRGDLLQTHQETHTHRAPEQHFLRFYNIWVTLAYDKHILGLLVEICVGRWRCEGRSGQMLDFDLLRLWWTVPLSLIVSTLGNPNILTLTTSLRTELLEICPCWQWLLLIGSSCLLVFIHPLSLLLLKEKAEVQCCVTLSPWGQCCTGFILACGTVELGKHRSSK